MDPSQPRLSNRIRAVWVLFVWSVGAVAQTSGKYGAREIPKVWDEAALADWATPVAGLNVRPTHISAKEYYSFRVENLRTYPFYIPGREPPGYWEMLRRVGPEPLIEPGKLKTEEDWIEAGRRVFEEADHPYFRTLDPGVITAARSRATFEAAHPLPDGAIFNLRWVPTSQGLALSTGGICSSCHVLHREAASVSQVPPILHWGTRLATIRAPKSSVQPGP